MNKSGSFSMVIMDRSIVIIGRKWRSKWYEINCMCSKWKRRKDGSCKHEREVLERIDKKIKHRCRIGKR